MKSLSTIAASLAICALAPTAAAAAAAQPAPSTTMVFEAGDLCAFPVREDWTGTPRTHTSDDQQRVTGASKVVVTNLDSGASLTVGDSGHTIVELGAGNADPYDPEWYFTRGQAVINISSRNSAMVPIGLYVARGNTTYQRRHHGGAIIDFATKGTVENLCDRL